MSVAIVKSVKDRNERLLRARWRGRTDLFWLAREVLGYKDIDDNVHGPIAQIVQQFPLPSEDDQRRLDTLTPVGWNYTGPGVPLEHLPGGRRRLILDPRGFYKTTINTICHSIQWVLNYPDITILVVHGKQDIAEDIMSEIRAHFIDNRIFRDIYSDYCPSKRDNTNATRYTVPNRRKIHKEPTLGLGSINTVAAGIHVDVLKFTDIVNEINTLNGDQMKKVIASFGMYRNVLTSPDRWMDLEGTSYHNSDLYDTIIEAEQKKPIDQREWRIHVRGAYKKDTGGNAYSFLPEERELRDLLDEGGSKISWFPAKFPVEALERERKDPAFGESLFACQRLNNPIDTSEDKAFPLHKLKTKTHDEMRKVPVAYYTTTVDLAETDKAGSDYSVLLTCGWDGWGRCYVVDCRHGKFLADDVIRQLFDIFTKWRPRHIKIEETGYVRGLKTSIRRYEDTRGVYLPLLFLPRENDKSKIERIQLTLQPWYQREDIYFDDSLSCFEHFRKELTSFPKGRTDDLIDALADQFQGKEWAGREVARPTDTPQFETYLKTAMDAAFDQKVYGRPHPSDPLVAAGEYFDLTGGL